MKKRPRLLPGIRPEIPAGSGPAFARHPGGRKYKTRAKVSQRSSLSGRFATSRITVGRAVRELKDRGLVETDRRLGNVRASAQSGQKQGLVRPADPRPGRDGDLRSDLQWIGRRAVGRPACFALGKYRANPGHQRSPGAEIVLPVHRTKSFWSLLRTFGAHPKKDETNRAIVHALEKARIPIVLLDRCFLPSRNAANTILWPSIIAAPAT